VSQSIFLVVAEAIAGPRPLPISVSAEIYSSPHTGTPGEGRWASGYASSGIA
jgi:hypothetical protein